MGIKHSLRCAYDMLKYYHITINIENAYLETSKVTLDTTGGTYVTQVEPLHLPMLILKDVEECGSRRI